MKVQIREGERDFTLSLPTRMIFNRFVIRKVFKSAKLGQKAQQLSPGAVDALIAELNRIRKTHGAWELVEVKSANGEIVKVIL